MDNPRTDQPAAPAGEKEKEKAAGPGGNRVTGRAEGRRQPGLEAAGTLQDQVKTMESEGQAQPQEGDLTPEELDDPMAGSPDRNPGRDNPGQRPLTDNKAGG